MDDVAFKARTAKGHEDHAAGKGMAVRPAVKPAHNVFLDKNDVQTLEKFPQSRKLFSPGDQQETGRCHDPPVKITDFMGPEILVRCGGKTQDGDRSADCFKRSGQNLFTTYI